MSKINSSTESLSFSNKINNTVNNKIYWYLQDQFFENEDKFLFSIYSQDKMSKLTLFLNSLIVNVDYVQPIICKNKIGESENEILNYRASKIFKLKNLPSYWSLPIKLLVTFFKLESEIRKIYCFL